jgi:UTP--glucose-1-phosphate uridylyltransferase
MKAVIPAAGLGTRMLPGTKSVPKELHPVRGKPAIQWTLEEAVGAGLTEFVVVTSPFKFILKHYLTPLGRGHPLRGHPDLEDLEQLLRDITIAFVEQPLQIQRESDNGAKSRWGEPLHQTVPPGLGRALLCCKKHIGAEPFVVLLPDNVCPVGSKILKDLLKVHKDYARSCVVLMRATPGVVTSGAFLTHRLDDRVHEVQRVIPRYDPAAKDVELRGTGRFVLEPAAIGYLERARIQGEMDELPALNGLAQEGRLLGMVTEEEICHLGGT